MLAIGRALGWRHNERFKSPTLRLFAQLFIQAQIKENIMFSI